MVKVKGGYLLEALRVVKIFGTLRANDKVTLKIRPGYLDGLGTALTLAESTSVAPQFALLTSHGALQVPSPGVAISTCPRHQEFTNAAFIKRRSTKRGSQSPSQEPKFRQICYVRERFILRYT